MFSFLKKINLKEKQTELQKDIDLLFEKYKDMQFIILATPYDENHKEAADIIALNGKLHPLAHLIGRVCADDDEVREVIMHGAQLEATRSLTNDLKNFQVENLKPRKVKKDEKLN